jgi:hypothetical protein
VSSKGKLHKFLDHRQLQIQAVTSQSVAWPISQICSLASALPLVRSSLTAVDVGCHRQQSALKQDVSCLNLASEFVSVFQGT